MKSAIALAALLATAAPLSHAASCGTISSPTACSITVGGTNTFTVTGFNFLNHSASGGGLLYEGDDINIDISSGGGLSMVLTFTKNQDGPAPGIVFLANPGNASGFTFSYNVALTAAVPGSATLADPVNLNMTDSHAGNGSASVQWAMSGAPICLVFTNSSNADCSLAPGTTTSFTGGDIVSLSGNSGNTSILSFRNLYNSTFTADQGSSTPEPTSFALLGLGLAALKLMRKP